MSTLSGANLTGANLRNAYLRGAFGLSSITVDATSVYNQWTVFPGDFDPAAAGLTLVMSPTGDLDANDTLTAADVDMLANKIRGRSIRPDWLPDAAFDMNGDSHVTVEDHRAWVRNLAHTWFGDADLNGVFESVDFVQVFVGGKYETGEWYPWGFVPTPASWAEGDWNGDLFFDIADFITAFQDGSYEQGPRDDATAVSEPATGILGVVLLISLPGLRTRRYRRST